MGLTVSTARARVKRKFQIPTSDTGFDADIDDAVSMACDLISPFSKRKIPEDTSITLSANQSSFTIPSAGSEINRIYIRSSSSYQYALFTDWTQDGDTIYMYENFDSSMQLKILAYGDFDTSTIASISNAMCIPLIDFACSEFASFLAGNKTKYNIYMQNTGARAVDNLLNMSEWYEGRALKRLEKIADAEGLL
jgi:hypothetical protein